MLSPSRVTKEPKKLPFVELEEERDAADHVKREDTYFGDPRKSPPYNGFAEIARVEEERDCSRLQNHEKGTGAAGAGA